jgi:hypothetical protein
LICKSLYSLLCPLVLCIKFRMKTQRSPPNYRWGMTFWCTCGERFHDRYQMYVIIESHFCAAWRSNTTKEFSIAFYVKSNRFELSYRIHLKFNLSDIHISWKGYLIGSLTPKINIHLMAYKKKQTVRRCLPSKIRLSLSI